MNELQLIIKNNKMLIIGILLGAIITINISYAITIYYAGNEVSYNTTNSTLTNTDVQGAIDELYNKAITSSIPTTCPSNAICEWKKSWSEVAVGDYVQMIPNPGTLDEQDRYATDTTKTGYSTVQYIYPKELHLWRVIKVNTNGTIEMVSEYVSSTDIYFGQAANGTTGDTAGVKAYKNYVGYLNTLASQYKNPAYTQSARAVGYNNQTQYISNTTYFNGNSTPWTSSTTNTENQSSANESLGQGDTLYAYDTAIDTGLVQVAYGNSGADALIALKCNDTNCSNPTEKTNYWIASRRYYRQYISTYRRYQYTFSCRYVSSSGGIGSSTPRGTYSSTGQWRDYKTTGCSIRPIVTLKSGLNPGNALGTKENPFVLE